MELGSGSDLSRYKLGEKLGAGGMGVVYRAFDTRLERPVALKFLPPDAVGDTSLRQRFVREAKAASALNHPHIVTVFDIDRVTTDTGEVDVIAMELVDGEPLDRKLERGPLPLRDAFELAIQLADALAAAHRADIVHRDVKPGNAMVTASGQLKLLDFGLARNLFGADVGSNAPTVSRSPTMAGDIVGTPGYMSPEQALGQPADARSDVFAAGCVLYEMLAGRRPFSGDTWMEQVAAIVHGVARPITRERAEVPAALARVVDRCIAKDPAARYPSAVELHAELRTLLRAELVRLEQLVAERDLMGAWLLARELAPVVGDDRELERLRLSSTFLVSIRSDPPGATIEFRGYLDDPAVWHPIGTTPIEEIRLPLQALLFRATAPGHVAVEGAPYMGDSAKSGQYRFTLWREEEESRGMLRIPEGSVAISRFTSTDVAPVDLPPFWLGRYEVTNREFQAFVDSGGYRNPDLWRGPFERDRRSIEWAEAVAGFVDATGRPGPSTWQFGAFPDGQGDHPVTGVSWYEAAAFAHWAKAELPTLHHWFRAAAPDFFSEIVQRARFGGDGTVPVGSSHAIGPLGAHDMAGNAFEWTESGDEDGRRYAVGGAYDEPRYTFLTPAALDPYDRGPNRGLRLARYDGAVPEAARQPISVRRPDFASRVPVGDEMFAAFESFYAYDQRPLEAAVDSVADDSPHYRWERVSYDAGYGGERVLGNLLIPKNASPPYQVVVFFPGSEAEHLESSLMLDGLPFYEFILRSGRALLYPIYKNMFERRIPGWTMSPAARRDVLIHWRKDLGRSIDYVASREDLDGDRIAFYGHSIGAVYGTVLTALEPRIDAALMLGGGINAGLLPPEADPINFASRVRVPTLMLTGRDDFVRPVETQQVPLFRLLGVPEEQKRLARFDGGHLPSDMNAVIREALAWLDRWLGPVATQRRSTGGG